MYVLNITDCRRYKLGVGLLVTLLMGSIFGCGNKNGAIETLESSMVWASLEGQDHPLVGQWWSPSEQTYLDEKTVQSMVQSKRIVLLGEKHDNIDHHRLQADVLGWVVSENESTMVAFEMLDDQDLVDSATKSTAELFAQDVHWADSGWPNFSLYSPIFEMAIHSESTLLAANPPRDQIMTSFMAEPEVLKNAKELESSELIELRSEIDRAHCGYSNEEMTGAMVVVQRFKDAWMARVIQENSQDSLVLIAGFGHTRIDRGVPSYLSSEIYDETISIQFREVEITVDNPVDYGSDAHLIYFTPRVDIIDPCVKFKEALEKMGH